MRAVIIAGGAMGDYAYIRQFIRPTDTIIAADSGYRHAVGLGVRPHVVLGDFDSLGEPPREIETQRVPAEKDFTDMELAVVWARERGIRDFLLLGAIGTRMDHTMTNILLLSELLEAGESGEVLDEHNRIRITDESAEIDCAAGDILSLIPLTACVGVTTENLKYPLADAVLSVGNGLGVSNVVTRNPARVTLRDGKLLVMLCQD